MLRYIQCTSVKAFGLLLSMLEKTGRVRNIKHFCWSRWICGSPDRFGTFRTPYTEATLKDLDQLFSRLVKLRPMLDELEIEGGGDDKIQQIVQGKLMQSELLAFLSNGK